MFFRVHQHQPAGPESKSKQPAVTAPRSFWVILGYLFWIGFYFGAMIMREVTK